MIVKKSYLKDRTSRMIESDKDVKRWINNLMRSPFKSLLKFCVFWIYGILKLIFCLRHNKVRIQLEDLKMLISPVVDVMEELLKKCRSLFAKPQFQNFSTYTVGLITCEDKKNIQAINRSFMDAKDQSSLNRFLTQSPWDVQTLQNKRLSLATEYLHDSQRSTGYFLIDDTINSKTGKRMENVCYHFDSKIGKSVLGHDIVTTHYVQGDIEYPVGVSLYVKKETCEQKKTVQDKNQVGS